MAARSSPWSRLAFAAPALATALAAAAVLAAPGCSTSSGQAAAAGDAGDGGLVAPPPPPPPPPVDAAAAPLDCATDLANDGVFGHLQCAGLYADFGKKTVVTAARPYAPALQLWADGATKQRWLLLPAGQKIDTTDPDEWVFPNGTKVFKEFSLDGKRVETRLYAKSATGTWAHTTYVWNDDDTDAVRHDGTVAIARDGGAEPPYQIPNGNECNECHAGRKDRLLGLEPVSLGLPGAQGITLASLVADGLLTQPPVVTTLALPEDTTGKAAAALGWLHVSCGPCHNRSREANAQNSNVRLLVLMSQLVSAGGGRDAGADGGDAGGVVSVSGTDAWRTTVDYTTAKPLPDGGTYSLIRRGDPGSSLVSYLSGRRSSGSPNQKDQMPPIVTRKVDVAGHQTLDDWITALP